MKRCVGRLDEEGKQKDEELRSLRKQLEKYQLEEEELNKIVTAERDRAEQLKAQAEESLRTKIEEMEMEKARREREARERQERL